MVRVTVTMAGQGTVTMADQGTAIMAATPLFMVATPQRTVATRPPIMVPGTTALGIIGAGDRGSVPLRTRGKLVAALRFDDLVPASDALGGRDQRNRFGGRFGAGKNASKNNVAGRTQKIDRGAKHWAAPQKRAERNAGCPRLPARHPGPYGFALPQIRRATSLVGLPDLFLRQSLARRQQRLAGIQRTHDPNPGQHGVATMLDDKHQGWYRR